jgi:hypothetical protein
MPVPYITMDELLRLVPTPPVDQLVRFKIWGMGSLTPAAALASYNAALWQDEPAWHYVSTADHRDRVRWTFSKSGGYEQDWNEPDGFALLAWQTYDPITGIGSAYSANKVVAMGMQIDPTGTVLIAYTGGLLAGAFWDVVMPGHTLTPVTSGEINTWTISPPMLKSEGVTIACTLQGFPKLAINSSELISVSCLTPAQEQTLADLDRMIVNKNTPNAQYSIKALQLSGSETLSLVGKNQVSKNMVRDNQGNLLSSNIFAYDTKAHAETDDEVTGLLYKHRVVNVYDLSGNLDKSTSVAIP